MILDSSNPSRVTYMSLILFAISPDLYKLIRHAVTAYISDLEMVYEDFISRDQNTYTVRVVDRTLRDIKKLQDFVEDFDKRFNFR